ncbi:phosphoinositide-interacting protein-like [Engraulis encrasicolus]|uniref:phosphoinositide-interacting protein-like n=1 Tax=Engraulis encrasicolus TaxID=184585 RepID=UPI002FD5CADF
MLQPELLSCDHDRDAEKSGRCALCAETDGGALQEPRLWTYYHKPIIVIIIGGLMLGAGAIISLLDSFAVIELPPAIGATCFSIGLIFVVLGMVWVPIIKDKLRRKGQLMRRGSEDDM